MYCRTIICIFTCLISIEASKLMFKHNLLVNEKNDADIVTNIGCFWQVTDFHYDEKYSVDGVPRNMCHQSKQNRQSNHPGIYGDYLCDAPWKLVVSAIEGMKVIHNKPDFIIWTGDSVPHVNNSELNQAEVYKIIRNVTDKLAEVFPNITIYPVLGNHDPYPENLMSPNAGDEYYKGILKTSHWEKLLAEDQQNQFMQGGYYSSMIKPGLRLLGLNTNLYNQLDTLVVDMQDPASQFKWMEEQLQDARAKQEKVYIISHVPPGAFERLKGVAWFYPQFNQQYLKILLKFTDVIVGQFYGHEHTDSFRLLRNDKDKAVSTLFLSPAVTPWKSSFPGVGANNPAIRLYLYRKDTGDILDYNQYYINLTEANILHKASWKLEYKATELFTLSDVSNSELDRLVQSFQKDEPLFEKYLVINTVSYNLKQHCNDTCKQQQICSISNIDLDHYHQCINQIGTPRQNHTTRRHIHTKRVPIYMFYVISGIGGVIVTLTVLFTCFCICDRKQKLPYKYHHFTTLVN